MEFPTLEDFATNETALVEEPTKKSGDGFPTLEEFTKTSLTPAKKSSLSSTIKFQPEESDFDITKNLADIQNFYQQTFKTDLPYHVGQNSIHNEWGLDHRKSMDVGLNPNSNEGKTLINYLKENNIPFLAFTQAKKGVSTSPHIHIGRPSHKTNEKYNVGTVINPDENITDFPTLEEFQQTSPTSTPSVNQNVPEDFPQLKEFHAPLSKPNIEFKRHEVPLEVRSAIGSTSFFTPKINDKIENPNALGQRITTEFTAPLNPYTGRPNTIKGLPTTNDIVDAWLNKLDPKYAVINKAYRAETKGLNLINIANNDPNAVETLGNGKYKISAYLTPGALEVMNAYADGGYEAAFKKSEDIKARERQLVNSFSASKKDIDEWTKNHPYLSSVLGGLAGEGVATAHSYHTLKVLGNAMKIAATKGFDSQEYLDAINEERETKYQMEAARMQNYSPKTTGEGLISGIVAGGAALPRLAAIARTGGMEGLTGFVYLENLHRGNRQAALAALPLAIMGGAGHGASEFAAGEGGTIAPFRIITKEDINTFKESPMFQESTSIRDLSPFERQVLLRGVNALSMTAGSVLSKGLSEELISKKDIKELASDFIIGLTFPVGKARSIPREVLPESAIGPEPAKISQTQTSSTGILPQPRIDIPITEAPKYGAKKLGVIENQREIPLVIYPSSESPNVGKYGESFDSNKFVSEAETGFQARGTGAQVRLDLDTAALNWLDLKRALETNSISISNKEAGSKTYINPENKPASSITIGNKLALSLEQRKAAEAAFSVLDNKLTPEVKEFFTENEDSIRAALKTNWEASRARSEFDLTKAQKEFSDAPLPRDIRPVAKDEDISNEKKTKLDETLGNQGAFNREEFVNRERAYDINNEVRNIINNNPKKTIIKPGGSGTFSMGLDPTRIDFKVLKEKAVELAQLVSFHIEDLYHRGMDADYSIVMNRLQQQIPELYTKLTSEQKREWYNSGVDYWNSNDADPFFSRMKRDAVEKLPNNVSEEQARNVLKQHKDEFEWTSGLEEFLNENRGKKISKQELVDVIQKGQVRVEASVASEQDENKLKLEIKEIRTRLDDLASKSLDAYEEIEEYKTLRKELDLKEAQLNVDKPKYSLKAYTGEKLELPGAVNSKEVKLISPVLQTAKELIDNPNLPIDIAKYNSPHWDEPNVVAHYRANDRITTDNKSTYFGEEFQSDWNHDIRERGIIGELKPLPKDFVVELNPKWSENSAKAEYKYQVRNTKNNSIEGAGDTTYDAQKDYSSLGDVHKNPFMSHSWKELVMKRFIRDAVVAKNEDGSYKYDGVSWTTALQQMERYGDILEGKDFEWQKNSDGTYTFKLSHSIDNEVWETPHELNNISLERFAELTTKEAADFVREQENSKGLEYIVKRPDGAPIGNFDTKARAQQSIAILSSKETGQYSIEERSRIKNGKFSLAEAANIRKEGSDKYNDYDVALVNIAKKIGKRFGSSYSIKEIDIPLDLKIEEQIPGKQKIHFLEITPAMRESLSKEGLPLYGLGGSEKLATKEVGVRNRITSLDVFDSAKNDLVEAITKDDSINGVNGTVLNSGLNPDAFLDQARLLYKGLKEFSQFSSEMLNRFGDAVKPYLEEMWQYVKEFHKNEKGFLRIGKKKLSDEVEDASKVYLTDESKHQSKLDTRFIDRGIKLAQNEPEFEKVYNVMRKGQRSTNSFESTVLRLLKDSNDSLSKENHDQVGQALYNGLVDERTILNRSELITGSSIRPALNSTQADAYENFYKAQHLNLDIRKQTILYGMRQRAFRLNDRLTTATPGSLEEGNILHQMGELSDRMDAVDIYYNQLKDSGYFSLQRDGEIAAYIESPTGEKIYQQFKKSGLEKISTNLSERGLQEAKTWLQAQIDAGADPNTADIYDVRKPEDIATLTKKLGIGAFEDLIDSSGVNAHSPEIEKLRDEIYAQFPSYSYQIKRDFTAGYDRTWESAVKAVTKQTELYGSSFYSRVAGEEAKIELANTKLQEKDPNLHQLAKAYIEDETTSTESTAALKALSNARRVVYALQLGYDFNQFYMNAITQPITQTYNYFARVENPATGDRLSFGKPEKYFMSGTKLALDVARDTAPSEFKDIYNRLVNEKVIEPEFTKSLLETETETLGKDVTQTTFKKLTSIKQHEHWASVFMRAGEKVTRTQAAAEAYLIGKNEFGLKDEPLVDFIVRAVDATQSNPTRGENPYVVRGRPFGANAASREAGKIIYQFNTFNHMWLENLALNIKSDIKHKSPGATIRTLYPLIILGGLRGLPLANAAFGLYTMITGEDPKKKLDKVFGNNSLMEQMALYGATTSAGLSAKITPSIPFVDSFGSDRSSIPLLATSDQIKQGFSDLFNNQKERGIETMAPRFIRGPLKAGRFYVEGVKNRDNSTVIPQNKVNIIQLLGQGINISPNKVIEQYENKTTGINVARHKKYIRPIRRKLGI